MFSRFSQKGLMLRVNAEVVLAGGVSEQEVRETRTAPKEMGLVDDLKLRE